MKKEFDAQTSEISEHGALARILLVDGHNSHYTVEGLDWARDHNIHVLAYPPHCTHALQGLDVVLFSVFKRRYSTAFKAYELDTGEKVTKDAFLSVIEKPWCETFTEENIFASFRATGVW
ncbi:hypothetical protein EXIGLDRAFT_650534, partial [Exidia glandulosa HHB12029]